MPDRAVGRGLDSPAASLVPVLALLASASYPFVALSVPEDLNAAVYGGWVAALAGFAAWGLKASGLGWTDLGLGGRPGAVRALALGAGLAALFFIAQAQAGFYLGFGWRPLPRGLSAVALFVSIPVIVVAGEVLFHGLLLRSLTRRFSFGWGLGLSSVAFGLAFSDLALFAAFGVSGVGTYVLLTTLTSTLTGAVLGTAYYKTNWNLSVPVALGVGIQWGTVFLPIAPRFFSPAEAYTVDLLALVVVLAAVAFGMREYRFLARRHLDEEHGPRRDRFLGSTASKETLRTGAAALGLAAFAVVAFVTVSSTLLGAQPPMLAVASGSMSPALVRGDLVVVQHVPPAEIQVGTIIVFSSPCLPGPTIHRVVARTVSSTGTVAFTTQGDANPAPDPCPVSYDEVKGRVVGVVPGIGYAVLVPQATIGAVLVLGVVVALAPHRRSRFPRRVAR